MWVLLFPFVILTVVISLFVVIGIYSWQKEKERTRVLQATATQLGWSFYGQRATQHDLGARSLYAL